MVGLRFRPSPPCRRPLSANDLDKRVEGPALYGFATETALAALPNPNILMWENANCRSS